MVGKRGVVKDPRIHRDTIVKVIDFSVESGFSVLGLTFSPVKGPEGNIEYLIHLKKEGPALFCSESGNGRFCCGNVSYAVGQAVRGTVMQGYIIPNLGKANSRACTFAAARVMEKCGVTAVMPGCNAARISHSQRAVSTKRARTEKQRLYYCHWRRRYDSSCGTGRCPV